MAPPESYNLKAWTSGSLKRPPSKRHDFGLDFEYRQEDGNFYVTRVEALAKGLTDLKVGDMLLKFQDQYAAGNFTLDEIKSILNDELRVSFEALHPELIDDEIKIVDNNNKDGGCCTQEPVMMSTPKQKKTTAASMPTTNRKKMVSPVASPTPRTPKKKTTSATATPGISPLKSPATTKKATPGGDFSLVSPTPRSPTKKKSPATPKSSPMKSPKPSSHMKSPKPSSPMKSPTKTKISPKKNISDSTQESTDVSVDVSEITEPSVAPKSPSSPIQSNRNNNAQPRNMMSNSPKTPLSSPKPKQVPPKTFTSPCSSSSSPRKKKTTTSSKPNNSTMMSSPKPQQPSRVKATPHYSSPRKPAPAYQSGPTLDYNLKAWVSGSLTRPPSKRHDFGLDFDFVDGVFWVTRCEGLAKELTEVRVGDRLLKFQNQDASCWTLDKINQILTDELHVSFETLHPELMGESITEIDMDIDIGDVVPLMNMDDSSLDGQNVQVLREGKNGNYLVKIMDDGSKNQKILVKSHNLNYELLPNKIQLKC